MFNNNFITIYSIFQCYVAVKASLVTWSFVASIIALVWFLSGTYWVYSTHSKVSSSLLALLAMLALLALSLVGPPNPATHGGIWSHSCYCGNVILSGYLLRQVFRDVYRSCGVYLVHYWYDMGLQYNDSCE